MSRAQSSAGNRSLTALMAFRFCSMCWSAMSKPRGERHQLDPTVVSTLVSLDYSEANQLVDRAARRCLREPETARDLMDRHRLGDMSQDEHRPRLRQRHVEVDQQIRGLGLGQAEHPPEELLQTLVSSCDASSTREC